MNQNNLKKENVMCEICHTRLRLCAGGLICNKNHLVEKGGEEWLNIESAVTKIQRPICIVCDNIKCDCEISGGFMLKTR